MTTAFVVTVALCIFGIFGSAILYAELTTRGIYAPGAKKPE